MSDLNGPDDGAERPVIPQRPEAPRPPEEPEEPEEPDEPGEPEMPPGAQPPQPADSPQGGQQRRSRPGPRRVTLAVLLVLGLGALAGGVMGLVAMHGRRATREQIAAAGQREFAQQWRRLTAGQIFPRTVRFPDSTGFAMTATLVGIAPQSDCAAATDQTAARILDRAGCVAVLRATYADQSRTVLATVGVVVMRSPSGARSAFEDGAGRGQGDLLPVSFPSTVASQFAPAAREWSDGRYPGGRYLLFDAVGYADGRATAYEPADKNFITSDNRPGETATTDLSAGLLDALGRTFTAPVSPCGDPDVRC